MPAEIVKIFELVGLGAPLLYCGAVFALFAWLDGEASDQAKGAIVGWMKPVSYDRDAVARAILELFDRIYSSPLVSVRAFWRSMLFSTVVTAAVSIEIYEPPGEVPISYQAIFYLFALAGNVVSDYISLFFVRWWLARRFPSVAVSTLTAVTIATVIVYIFFVCRVTATEMIFALVEGSGIERALSAVVLVPDTMFHRAFDPGIVVRSLVIAAMAVHLWLPLVAASGLLIRTFNYVVQAVKLATWFLKEGDQHPIKSIGYVAAAIVFVASAGLMAAGRAF